MNMPLSRIRQSGFTLIELVVVIVLLGILAVTAMPKMLNLQSDAKNARLQALAGSIRSLNNMLYSGAITQGIEKLNYNDVVIWRALQMGQGKSVDMTFPLTHHGYMAPIVGNLNLGLQDASDWQEFYASDANAPALQLGGDNGDSYFIYSSDTEIETLCYLEYRGATSVGDKPQYLIEDTEC